MKTKILSVLLAIISLQAFSQITVTDANLVNVGDVIYQASDTMPSSSITIGNSGANQTWDFSALQTHLTDTIEFINPATTPYANIHSSANLCFEDEGEYIYLEKISSSFSVVGIDAIAYSFLIAPLPLTYGNSTTVPSAIMMDSVLPNMFFPDTIAPLLTMGQAHTIDSIRITMSTGSDSDVDAYGTATLNSTTYDVLRLKNTITTITEYNVYCTDTIFNMNSGWYSASALMPNEVDDQNSYSWWTNDANVKMALVQIETDSLGNPEWVDFLYTPVVSGGINISLNEFKVYPIPTSYNLTIEAQNSELIRLNLVDINGRLIMGKEFIKSTNLDLSQIAKGVYYLKLNTAEGELTKKIIVE